MAPKTAQKEFPLTVEQKKQLDSLIEKKNEASVDEWKALGNCFFGQNSYLSAIKCYTKALERQKADPPSSDVERKKYNAEVAILLSNRSASYLKSSMFSGPAMALKDAQEAIALNPSWPKGFLRVGDAQFNRKHFDDAQAAYEMALKLDPNCEAAKISLKAATKELFLAELDQKEKEEEKEAMKEGYNKKIDKGKDTEPQISLPTPEETFVDPAKARQKQKEEETSKFIQAVGKEISVADNRTGMKPRTVSLAAADRQAGVDYKRQLLGNFRKKVEGDETLRSDLEQKRAATQLLGDGIDYRRAEDYYNTYARSTDGIGLGITSDAFKEHKGTDKRW